MKLCIHLAELPLREIIPLRINGLSSLCGHAPGSRRLSRRNSASFRQISLMARHPAIYQHIKCWCFLKSAQYGRPQWKLSFPTQQLSPCLRFLTLTFLDAEYNPPNGESEYQRRSYWGSSFQVVFRSFILCIIFLALNMISTSSQKSGLWRHALHSMLSVFI